MKTKEDTRKSLYALFEGRRNIRISFKSGIFQLKKFEGKGMPVHVAKHKVSDGSDLEILTPK